MIGRLHILNRKIRTLVTILNRCQNWLPILLHKVGLAPSPDRVILRSGLEILIFPPLRSTWGEVFEAAVADTYGIAQAEADLIIDVGGNIGAFSCLAAQTHPSAAIISYEPSTKHAARIAENADHNGLANIRVINHPVTRDGRNVNFSTIGTGGSSGIFLTSSDPPVERPSIQLDPSLIGAASSVFIKLDCEGAEAEIIAWLCEHFAKSGPRFTIIGEYHPWCPVPIEDSLKLLRDRGFSTEKSIQFDELYLVATREAIPA